MANKSFLVVWLLIINIVLPYFLQVSAQEKNGWQWQYPKPQGNSLNDMFIFNKDTIVAVGDCGTFMKTTDGGKSWDVNHHIGNSSCKLNSVHFTDEKHGWVAGGAMYSNENILLRTEDGGETWTNVSVDTKLPLLSVCFVDPDTGIAVGEDGIVIRTTDGGRSWDTNKMDDYIGQFLDVFFLTRIVFTDKNNGWVIGGGYYGNQLYRTTDCGRTWKWSDTAIKPRIWSPLSDIGFIRENTVCIVGQQGDFIKSNDGGLTWKYQNLSEKYKNEKYQYLASVAFTDSLTGWIVGGDYYSIMLKTTDGGENWTEMDSAKNEGQLYRVRFSDKNNGLRIGQFGNLLRTTDGGNSWNQLRNDNIFLRSVSFADEKTGWAVGDSGLILNTTDGGNNWIKQFYDRDRLLYSVHAIDKKNVWVTGGMLNRVGEPAVVPKPPILYTTDGGKHWHAKETDYPYGVFFFVTFRNDSVGWLAGKELLKTTNKGQTWEKIPADFNSPLDKVQFVNDSTGWISYSIPGTMILKTKDKGKTWKEQLVDSSFNMRSFYFVNEEVGYAVGQLQWKEAIIKTTNGGESWFSISKPLIGGYEAIYFQNETDGWIGGFDQLLGKSVIIKTTDGGNTWYDQNCPLNAEVTNFYFLNSSTAWAVGDGIAKTSNGGGPVSVEENNNGNNEVIPSSMGLLQNYPNPFNPSTVIQYRISKSGPVSLKIYDLLGRLVTTLVHQYQPEGEYTVRWSADTLPSGIYFYQLRSGSHSETKKMLLLR